MKNIKVVPYILAVLLVTACHQEVITPPDPPAPSGEPGSADFTKFVSIGNSLTAGFQAGALYTDGQQNSFPAIMAKQFALVSDNDNFDQPDINSVNGYNSSFSNPGAGVIRGRLVLFDPDGSGPAGPSPVPAGTPGVPAPYNTADLPGAYNGDKSKLNNFGVPGILLAQALTPLTGGPASGNPAYNALYARFASNPGTSTILEDALAAAPTFFSFWLGNNDVLGYATTGGSGAVPLTDLTAFTGQYTTAINAILGSNPNLKGVIATIPNVTAIPFFRVVAWNAVPLDAATAGALTSQLATNYNAFLDGMAAHNIITPAERDLRKIAYTAGQNAVLINDETLTDLTPHMTGPYQGLRPYAMARQTKNTDLITLSAGSHIGKNIDITGDGTPDGVNGVSLPLVNTTNATTTSLKGDDLVLIPSEINLIQERVTAFNQVIAQAAANSNGRIALADVYTAFNNLASGAVTSVDGVPVNASFAPPFGLFSVDGVHPNNRGSAYLARIFVQAINEKFGSTVPLPNISTYHSTPLPVSPN